MERYLKVEGYFYNVGLDELLDILEDRGLQYFGLSDEDEEGLHVEGYLFANEEQFVSLLELDDVEFFGYYREEEEEEGN